MFTTYLYYHQNGHSLNATVDLDSFTDNSLLGSLFGFYADEYNVIAEVEEGAARSHKEEKDLFWQITRWQYDDRDLFEIMQILVQSGIIK